MTIRIGCVVEGHGEREALPILLRRLAHQVIPGGALEVPIMRTPKSRLMREGELERTVELTARRVAPRGGIVVVLDSDDDCPGELGPQLLQRARRARSDLPLTVTLAKREFEAWFIAAAESLRPATLESAEFEAVADPESIRGAKEWVGGHLLHDHYLETLHQPSLTDKFDPAGTARALLRQVLPGRFESARGVGQPMKTLMVHLQDHTRRGIL